MITALLLAAALAAVALSALSSGMETGVYCLNRVRLRVRSERNEPAARQLAQLMERQEDLVITTLLGTNIADYLSTVCVTLLLLRVGAAGSRAEIYTTAILAPVILVLGGIIPKDWFRRRGEQWMYPLALPLAGTVRVVRATGLAWVLRAMSRGLIRRIDPEAAAREEGLLPRAQTVRLLQEGAARGGLTALQRDMIERVMNISHVRIESIMIPRERAASVSVDVSREDFLRVARMAHFSRLPVWRDNPANICGIVNVYDVLTDADARPIRDHVGDALYLRPHDTVPAALLTLQQARRAMAVVRDRTGQCIGILTVKDLVEEVVGELAAW